MSRRHPENKRRPTNITIAARVSPHIRLAFEEMRRQGRTYDEVEEGSGVLRTTRRPATAAHPDQAAFIDLDPTEYRVAA